MNQKTAGQTKQGGIGIFAMIALAIIVAGAAFIYTTSDAPNPQELKESATDAAKVTANKSKQAIAQTSEDAMDAGKEILENGKGTVVEAGKDAMADTANELVEGGKAAAVGAITDATEKIMPDKAGVFVDYSQDVLASAEGDIVIDFSADWCPSCRAFEKDVQTNAAQIPSDLTILKANFDKELDLRKKYGVTLQHTFVQVDAQGVQIAKWLGSPTLEAMVAKVQ